MDAIERLEQDHAKAKRVLTRAVRAHEAEDAEALGRAARQAVTLLTAHTRIEEELFYPAVRQASEEIDELVREGLEEHHVADTLMSEIEGMAPTDEQFAAKVQVLQESIEHHVEEEEQELFPKVRRAMGDQLDELGARMQQRHEELLGSAGAPVADEDLVDLTKEELYELAKERDLPGRSDMTKDELLDALRTS